MNVAKLSAAVALIVAIGGVVLAAEDRYAKHSDVAKKVDAPYLMQQQIIELESQIEEAEEELAVIRNIPEEKRDAVDKWKLNKLPSKIKAHERKLNHWYESE